MHRECLFAATFFVAGLGSPWAETTASLRLAPVRAITVEGTFETDDGIPPARDISGIACRPAPNGSAQRLCLVVNDGDRFAQFATIQDGRIVVGSTVALIGNKPFPLTLGSNSHFRFSRTRCGVWLDFSRNEGLGQGGRGGGLRKARVCRSSVQEENTR
jgi:hypothetical protein